MELHQQVKNFKATLQHAKKTGPSLKTQDKPATDHEYALQALSNNDYVPYGATLRVVEHHGSRAPYAAPMPQKRHPGFIRNELGGTFTS